MNQLKDIQTKFIDSIYNNNEELSHDVVNKKIAVADRLKIYKDNVFTTLNNNLKAKYLAIHKLVGEEFFQYAANEYIKKNKPVGGNLDEYGQNFDDFLTTFSPASELKYLPDIAKLEWLYHTAYFAANAEAINTKELSAIAPERLENLKFILHPSAGFLSSKFPIDKIYKMANGENIDVDINERGADILIIRPELKIEIIVLENSEFRFLEYLKNGKNLYQAFEHAAFKNDDFDLSYTISKFVNNGTFVGYR